MLAITVTRFIIPVLAAGVFGVDVSRVIHIREGVPAGTVLIPDLLGFLRGQSISTTNDKSTLLTIGNEAMPGANWFTIARHRNNLIVKVPPDRDTLCPSEFKLPETAVSADHGGVEFNDFKFPQTAQSINNWMGGSECSVKLSIIYGSSTNPSFTMIKIILDDVNDHAPTFGKPSGLTGEDYKFIIRVPETTRMEKAADAAATAFYRHPINRFPLPQAQDPDVGLNSIRGYRLEGQDSHLFRLEVGSPSKPATSSSLLLQSPALTQHMEGSIYDTNTQVSQLWLVPTVAAIGQDKQGTKLSPDFDHERHPEYNLVLVAYDGGSPQRTGRLPILLIVEDVNDNPPVFDQVWYSAELSEIEQPGHVVLEFAAHDADGSRSNSRISFRIPGEVGYTPASHSYGEFVGLPETQLAAANLFAVEQISNVETENGRFAGNIKKNYTYGRLVIRSQSKAKYHSAMSRTITAAQKAKTRMVGGLSRFSNDKYRLEPGSVQNKLNPGLRLPFLIEAYDHGQPQQLSTTVPVYVDIIDVNDHPPQIFVSYMRPIDRFRSHLLTTRHGWGLVKENVPHALLAQITVIDPDAMVPEITVMCNTNDSRFYLEELSNNQQEMNDARVTWNVKPDSSKVSKWTNSVPLMRSRRNAVSTQMFKLMLNTPLDREQGDSAYSSLIEFTLTCQDNTQGRLPGGQKTSQTLIGLVIEDVNDNQPTFQHSQYTFHVPENYPLLSSEFGTTSLKDERFFVGEIHAVDLDEGINAAIEYKLDPTHGSSVEIDPHTGRMYVTRPFDRETSEEVTFKAYAIDQRPQGNLSQEANVATSQRLTGTTDIRIVIDDLNDSPPVFEELNYHFEVEECVDGVRVGQVKATDADRGEAARLTYQLVAGSAMHAGQRDSSPLTVSMNNRSNHTEIKDYLFGEAFEVTTEFQIDPRSGVIHLKGRLDREKRAHYEFMVLATDNPGTGKPLKRVGVWVGNEKYGRLTKDRIRHTATATMLVTVLDHNDNPPQVISPGNHMEFALGPDQLIAGTTIFNIHATDPDLGENGTIEYRLLQVESDFGSWPKYGQRNAAESELTANVSHEKTDEGKLQDQPKAPEYPFAVDRTAGSCYLRENIPPPNVEGPRAYLLRIQVYDLGRPKSLNTSLIIRISRHSSVKNIAQVGFFNPFEMNDAGDRGNPTSDSETDPSKKSSARSLGLWSFSANTRISDRSMLVILATVFILLILTIIVLLLLVRYRRLFLRNLSFNGNPTSEGALSKANIGFVAGKHYDDESSNNGQDGVFAEIVTAPWVSSPGRGMDSPGYLASPTIYNLACQGNNNNNNNNNSNNRMCIKNPAACWTPVDEFTFTSPTMQRVLRSNRQHPVFHTPPTCVRYSTKSQFTDQPGIIQFPNQSASSTQHPTATKSTIMTDFRPTVIMDSTTTTPASRNVCLGQAVQLRSSNALEFNGCPDKCNNIVCKTVHDEGAMPPSHAWHTGLQRVAISLDELTGSRDSSDSKEYNQLLHQTDSPVLLPKRTGKGNGKNVILSRSDYQTLANIPQLIDSMQMEPLTRKVVVPSSTNSVISGEPVPGATMLTAMRNSLVNSMQGAVLSDFDGDPSELQSFRATDNVLSPSVFSCNIPLPGHKRSKPTTIRFAETDSTGDSGLQHLVNNTFTESIELPGNDVQSNNDLISPDNTRSRVEKLKKWSQSNSPKVSAEVTVTGSFV